MTGVTIQCNVVVPYFGRIRILIASYDRMLSKWRYINIWIIGRSLQGTVLNMFSSVFNVVKYNSDNVL